MFMCRFMCRRTPAIDVNSPRLAEADLTEQGGDDKHTEEDKKLKSYRLSTSCGQHFKNLRRNVEKKVEASEGAFDVPVIRTAQSSHNISAHLYVSITISVYMYMSSSICLLHKICAPQPCLCFLCGRRV